MKDLSGFEIYQQIKKGPTHYHEELHCVMIMDCLIRTFRLSSFLKKALLSQSTFNSWLYQYPKFKESYGIGIAIARENWELQEVDCIDIKEHKAWLDRGNRHFIDDSLKITVNTTDCNNPWQQYQAIMEQASHGTFSASEIKQLMEAVNIGTRVFETFKLQEEVDTMKDTLKEMGSRNGNNILPISKTAKRN